MDITLLAVIGALVLLAIVVTLVLAGRSKPASPPPAMPEQRAGVVDAGTAAVADVAGPLFGVDAHPDLPPGPDDDLTVLKGLGPKAAAQLNAEGITRYAQLAALKEDDIDALDARMGVFKGRLRRDRWVEQAAMLAAGNRAGFEATFGNLGS